MSDYDHSYHAGNHADVFKHVAWLAALAAVRRARVAVVETHGGSGTYRTAPQGEWEAGVGRLLAATPPGTGSGSGAVDRYLARVRKLCPDAPRHLPGSPLLSLDALGPTGTLRVHEAEPTAAGRLRVAVGRDGRVRLHAGDGWSALADLPAADEVMVLIDPPYVDRSEWDQAAAALVQLARHPGAPRAALWYPIKSHVRPGRLRAALREAGVPFVTAELLVTPVEKSATHLAGSGMLFLRPPESALLEIAAAAAALGPRLAPGPGWRALVGD